MGSATKRGTVRPSALTPELRSWIDNVIAPALVDRWLAQEAKKNLAADSAQVAECSEQEERLSAEGVLQ